LLDHPIDTPKEMKMKVLAVAALILVGFFGAVDHANAATDKWQPCLADDGSYPVGTHRCVWQANDMGNGVGHSYFHNRTGFHYISDGRAAAMLAR
jgi:hypothetical protein